MTPPEEILLNEMRYIASISTGQIQRTAKSALAIVSAMNAPLAKVLPNNLSGTSTDSRPQNCGTGHCSCIECPYPKPDWSAA